MRPASCSLFENAPYRVLIARLSPLRDVDRSLPHRFLFHEVRRALPEAYVDLAFFPPERAEDALSPLTGIHSRRPARDFDLILVSNAYILELLNLPTILLRSGIPLFAGGRRDDDPILLLGGSNAMAAQAIIREDGDALADGIFFGEGEGRVGEMVQALARTDGGRRDRLEAASASGPGLWVAGTRRRTVKAVCRPRPQDLPTVYPILNTPEAHTAYLQITWGCPAFCSFCFEGYDRKPYRELPAADLVAVARQLKQAQGVEEIGLYSFNFNTHGEIFDLLLELHRLFDRVSLKSQRADILWRVPGLIEAELAAEKREFTLGIEGISARQRAFLHKSLRTEEMTALLERLVREPIRRIKLFYILTGYETEDDLSEFRAFVRWLREARAASPSRPRVIFSVGPLVRMPFTPLRYDRLFLEEKPWRPLIGAVRSACETNGFEFRLAFDWAEYATTQVLALGGYWLVELLAARAREGDFYDGRLPREYWEALRAWMERAGLWNDAFLGEKGPDYPFPLEFVQTDIPADFLYRQYQAARAGLDPGYCLGDASGPGQCRGCGACPDEEHRQAILHHRIRVPDLGPYLAELRDVVSGKRRLRPIYYRLRTDAALSGVHPAFLNSFVFRQILASAPELTENLLSVREALFTVPPNSGRFPTLGGETVFALRAWDADALRMALAARSALGEGIEVLGPVEDFNPGTFTKAHLVLSLPLPLPAARAALEGYLRGAYVPFSLRRDGDGYGVEVPPRGLKKKVLFGGRLEGQEERTVIVLEVGPKLDLLALLRLAGCDLRAGECRVEVRSVEISASQALLRR
ncbi:MAG: radical SAM protein [Thermoflexales bacterium]|nr:radical SAM protein [Thermoflexales bacterium]